MALVIEDTWLPATLTVPPMDDEQFAAFCADHPDLFFETTAEGELLVLPPNYTLTGIRNQRICRQLGEWADRDGRGITSDPTTGFVLPSGARRSPDAAWISREKLDSISVSDLDRYWHLCPDFVIELRSHYDRLPVLRQKMREWLASGAALAWMIDAESRTIEIYRPGQPADSHTGLDSISGEGPVQGFTLDLTPVWNPLGR